MLHADRCLPAVRDVGVVGNRRLLLEIAQQTPRPVVDVAESLQRLLVRRQRTVERIGGKVGPSIVVDANDGDRQRTLRPQDVRVQDVVVVEPCAAANNRPIGELIREADSWLDVVRVLRPIGHLERRELDALRERVPDQVVAQPEIDGEPRRRFSSRPAPTRRTSTCRAASGTSIHPRRPPGSWS